MLLKAIARGTDSGLRTQRWGWLLHGKSFYLPHHTPDSMRKTSMSYRNIFFTIAQQKGCGRRDFEQHITHA